MEAKEDLREGESESRELGFQDFVETKFEMQAVVTEIRVEGRRRATGEVALAVEEHVTLSMA